MSCKKHGDTWIKRRKNNNPSGTSNYCSKCNDERNHQRAKKKKEQAVLYLGGCCKLCGYSKCHAALEFHHIHPEEKEFEPSKMMKRSWETIKAELDKCVLLCANCHREVHHGGVEL